MVFILHKMPHSPLYEIHLEIKLFTLILNQCFHKGPNCWNGPHLTRKASFPIMIIMLCNPVPGTEKAPFSHWKDFDPKSPKRRFQKWKHCKSLPTENWHNSLLQPYSPSILRFVLKKRLIPGLVFVPLVTAEVSIVAKPLHANSTPKLAAQLASFRGWVRGLKRSVPRVRGLRSSNRETSVRGRSNCETMGRWRSNV